MDFILLKWWWHIRQTDKTSVSIADNPDIKISKMIPSDYLNEFFIPSASISRSSFHSPYSSLQEYFPPPFPFDKRPNADRSGKEKNTDQEHFTICNYQIIWRSSQDPCSKTLLCDWPEECICRFWDHRIFVEVRSNPDCSADEGIQSPHPDGRCRAAAITRENKPEPWYCGSRHAGPWTIK